MRNHIATFGISLMILPVLLSCSTAASSDGFVEENIACAVAHVENQCALIEESGEFLNPCTVNKEGEIVYIPLDDWRSGFFPGIVWNVYKLTGEEKWLPLAEKYTEALESVQYLTRHHDIGFMIGASYLNGWRVTGNEDYVPVIVQAAKSLSTRFRPGAGIIQSWNVDRGWQSERGWKCPVIIDNMMNLELMFEAARLSADSIYYNIAVSHADATLANHFREDASSYHVVDYDPETGEVRSRVTAQGCGDESAWARGQAWALYGYVMCYRYTGFERYLEQAERVYDFIFSNRNMPADLIPYWDYDAPGIPDEPRDVSAAACVASALYELCTYVPDKGYRETADRIMESLASPAYRAESGTNGNFILMHSVGSIPHGAEIDSPLNYADYYFLEALLRRSLL